MPPIPTRRQQTVEAVYQSHEAGRGDGLRSHLGASLIGRRCERELWYTFRWAFVRQFEGRVLRLFKRGQDAEAAFVSELRGIGIEVHEIDVETGDQIRVGACGGHFGGSLDGVGIGFAEAPKAWHVLEFKTHNEKSFNKLKGEGVAASKPEHVAQMQVYMHLTGIERAFYLAENKNTSELYSERIDYCRQTAEGLLAKAERIISAQVAPERIGGPDWYECKFCDYRDVCHSGLAALRNCRTCLHSTPVEGGWLCERFNKMLTTEEQKAGCSDQRYLPTFVGAEPTGVENENDIVYEHWTDRGPDGEEPLPF